MEKKYESTNFNDFRVPDKRSPSYTKIHVDKDTGPDYCYTAIGNKKKGVWQFAMFRNITCLGEVC